MKKKKNNPKKNKSGIAPEGTRRDFLKKVGKFTLISLLPIFTSVFTSGCTICEGCCTHCTDSCTRCTDNCTGCTSNCTSCTSCTGCTSCTSCTGCIGCITL
ncbi:MAG: hypothetical protein AAB019_04625 [Planctomycetota bacterium]